MIGDYLSQTAIWRHVTGRNEFGDPTYAPDQPVPVRWEPKLRLVRNAQGDQVVSEARVFTEASVEPGDVLVYGGREWPIIAVGQVVGLDGAEIGREVAV
jgi:hypothetical protein